jgi:hypothetical protein
MGYDLRIHRGADYFNPAHQISREEGISYVESDPELRRPAVHELRHIHDDNFALLTTVDDPEGWNWLHWGHGNIKAKYPQGAARSEDDSKRITSAATSAATRERFTALAKMEIFASPDVMPERPAEARFC